MPQNRIWNWSSVEIEFLGLSKDSSTSTPSDDQNVHDDVFKTSQHQVNDVEHLENLEYSILVSYLRCSHFVVGFDIMKENQFDKWSIIANNPN